jgi:hypothetical protein
LTSTEADENRVEARAELRRAKERFVRGRAAAAASSSELMAGEICKFDPIC